MLNMHGRAHRVTTNMGIIFIKIDFDDQLEP